MQRSLVLITVAGLLAGCGSEAGDRADGADGVATRFRRAEQAGYEGQARILADGRVTFNEYLAAGRAMAECATRAGVPLKVTSVRDMYGRTVEIDPTAVLDGAAGARATRITERCQEREQLLVDEAWADQRPAISDEAYDLWKHCLADAGYRGPVPRSYVRIEREIDADLTGPCDRSIMIELSQMQGP